MTGAIMASLVAATTKSSGGSATFVIFLVLIALVGYFLLIRPQKQKARRQRDQQSGVAVGDDILTVGGIVGRVVAMDADRVTIVSGEGTVGFAAVGNEPTRLVLVRSAIARKVDPVAPPMTQGAPDDDHSGYADHTGSDAIHVTADSSVVSYDGLSGPGIGSNGAGTENAAGTRSESAGSERSAESSAESEGNGP